MTKQLLILLFTFSIFSCGKTWYLNRKCPKGSVSVTVINKSTKPISRLTLITNNIPIDSIEGGSLAVKDKTLLCFESVGESTYHLIIIFNDGYTLKSQGVYVEDGYSTIETVYNDSIAFKYNSLY